MAITFARTRLARVFTQRCFYLFFALLVLIAVGPLATGSVLGRVVVSGINAFILLATVAAVGRTVMSFVIALLLAAPTMGFQILALRFDFPEYLVLSAAFGAAFYLAATVYLLAYVFRREVMTADKLYGAAAAYLMTGVLWAYLFALSQHFFPGAFSAGGKHTLDVADLIYYSFTVLTSTGFGDVVPVAPVARSLTVIEEIVGMLFVAILIARLAGIYPPRQETKEPAD